MSSIWSPQPTAFVEGPRQPEPTEGKVDTERASWEVERQAHERERLAWGRERDLLQALLDSADKKSQKAASKRVVGIYWPVDENDADGSDLLSRLDPIDVVAQLQEIAQPHGELGPFKAYSSGRGIHQDTLETLGVELRSCSKAEGRSSTTTYVCVDAVHFALTAASSPSQVTVVLVSDNMAHLPLASKLKAIGCKVVLVARSLDSSKRLLRAVASEVHELERQTSAVDLPTPPTPKSASCSTPMSEEQGATSAEIFATPQASIPVTPTFVDSGDPATVVAPLQPDADISTEERTTAEKQDPAGKEGSGWGLEPESQPTQESSSEDGWGVEVVAEEPTASWEGEGWGVPPPPGYVNPQPKPQAASITIDKASTRRPTTPLSQVRQPLERVAQPGPSTWASVARAPLYFPPPPPPPVPEPIRHYPETHTAQPTYIFDPPPRVATSAARTANGPPGTAALRPLGPIQKFSPHSPIPISTPKQSTSAPRPGSEDLSAFDPLLRAVASFLPHNPRPFRTKVAYVLTEENGFQAFYPTVGFQNWKGYSAAAEESGLVQMDPGAGQGQEWIALAQLGRRRLVQYQPPPVPAIRATPPVAPLSAFDPLLNVLAAYLPARTRPLRTDTACALTKDDKKRGDFYRARGFIGWKEYTAAARAAGLVEMDPGPTVGSGSEWIALTETGRRRQLGSPSPSVIRSLPRSSSTPSNTSVPASASSSFEPLLCAIASFLPDQPRPLRTACSYVLAKNKPGGFQAFYNSVGYADWRSYVGAAESRALIVLGDGKEQGPSGYEWIGLTDVGLRLLKGKAPASSSSSTPIIPSRASSSRPPSLFLPLLEAVAQGQVQSPQSLHSQIGAKLLKNNPTFYKDRGFEGWRAYVKQAEKEGWVVTGVEEDVGGREWVALAAKGREAVL